jgi:hypothetical protein
MSYSHFTPHTAVDATVEPEDKAAAASPPRSHLWVWEDDDAAQNGPSCADSASPGGMLQTPQPYADGASAVVTPHHSGFPADVSFWSAVASQPPTLQPPTPHHGSYLVVFPPDYQPQQQPHLPPTTFSVELAPQQCTLQQTPPPTSPTCSSRSSIPSRTSEGYRRTFHASTLVYQDPWLPEASSTPENLAATAAALHSFYEVRRAATPSWRPYYDEAPAGNALL